MIIQINNQYNSHVPQTSFKSTMLPVVIIQTTQTNQSQTLAQPSSKVKTENATNLTFGYTTSSFPLSSCRTVYYQLVCEYTKTLLNLFLYCRDGGFN